MMRHGRPNILVIDDDAETLDTIKLHLSEIANVTTVSNGRQAINYAHEQHPDIILLDIEMPVMDGFRTLTHLRNIKECINVQVIMLTGKSDKYSVMNSMAMGIDGYLLKPVSKDILIDKVREVLQKEQQPQNLKTVLAIDDDMSYLKQINSLLQGHYNVIMINSAKLALDYLMNHVPDVILLDYQMPLYNGVTMINMIHQKENCQNVPFIILSGSLDQNAVLDFYPHNPVTYLTKPVSQEVLLEKIQLALTGTAPQNGYDERR